MITCPNCRSEWDLRVVAHTTTPVAPKPLAKVDGGDEVGPLLDSINDGALNEFETGFIQGIRERYEQYGTKIKMSEKQMTVLRKIAGAEF